MLGLPCGLVACEGVDVSQRRVLENEYVVGMGNVAVVSSKQKNEDPLSFLKTPSCRFGSGVEM